MKGRQTMHHARVEILAQIMRESPKAWLLDDGVTSKWVPRSLVQRVDKSLVKDSIYETFLMPQWLAESRGFM